MVSNLQSSCLNFLGAGIAGFATIPNIPGVLKNGLVRRFPEYPGFIRLLNEFPESKTKAMLLLVPRGRWIIASPGFPLPHVALGLQGDKPQSVKCLLISRKTLSRSPAPTKKNPGVEGQPPAAQA